MKTEITAQIHKKNTSLDYVFSIVFETLTNNNESCLLWIPWSRFNWPSTHCALKNFMSERQRVYDLMHYTRIYIMQNTLNAFARMSHTWITSCVLVNGYTRRQVCIRFQDHKMLEFTSNYNARYIHFDNMSNFLKSWNWFLMTHCLLRI